LLTRARLPAILVAVLLLAPVLPASAQSGWAVDSARGTVVRLVEEHWVEVALGETVPSGVPLRTLRGSSATLKGSAGLVTLGSGTLVRLQGNGTRQAILEHYSGSLELFATGIVELRTPTLTITAHGQVDVAIVGDTTRYEVHAGTAEVIETATGVTSVQTSSASSPSAPPGPSTSVAALALVLSPASAEAASPGTSESGGSVTNAGPPVASDEGQPTPGRGSGSTNAGMNGQGTANSQGNNGSNGNGVANGGGKANGQGGGKANKGGSGASTGSNSGDGNE
jgi:hypothetical protein